MLVLAVAAWIVAVASLGYGILKTWRYPFNVVGLVGCSGLLLLGLFWWFPLLRDRLGG